MTRANPDLETHQIAAATAGRHGGPTVRVRGVTTDSRNIETNDLFVALRGPTFDGHDFVEAAFADGAAAVLVDAIDPPPGRTAIRVDDTLTALGALGSWWRRRLRTPVLALTGSNGKTSTKELIAALLATERSVLRTRGNLNNRIGVPMTLLGLEARHEVAVVEMGMNARGEIADLTAIAAPDVALLLNVGPAHIGELGSIEAIAEAKAEMLHAAPSSARLVVNADDHRVMAHAKGFPAGRLRTFGEAPGADVRLLHRAMNSAGQRLTVSVDGVEHQLELARLGRHDALNATAALAAVTALPPTLCPSPERWELAWTALAPVEGRFATQRRGEWIVVDDAYNANPASLQASLDTVSERRGDAPLAVVLGEMNELGDFSDDAHRDAGRAVAAAGARSLLTFGSRARPAAKAAREAGVAAWSFDDDLDALVVQLVSELEPGSWVLLKGSRASRLERVIDRLETS